MKTRKSIFGAIAIGAVVAAFTAAPVSAHGDATCSDVFGSGIVVHGQHIVGDYVTGIGGLSGDFGWPPKGGIVGATIGGNGGAALPGGPGPAFHFEIGAAPGASFCNDSKSPGFHV